MSEKEFQDEVEEILNRHEALDCLVIGEPNNDAKWYVALRISEMIKEYWKKKSNIEISLFFSILEVDIIPNINKMNTYDIQILRIQPFVEGLFAYFDSKRAENKNFIYISHKSTNLNQINEKVGSLVLFHLETVERRKDKILCKIQVEEGKRDLEFSYPHKELIEKYRNARKEALNKVIKRQI